MSNSLRSMGAVVEYERFIATAGDFYGSWGIGKTRAEAEGNCRLAGGKGGKTVHRCTSHLPFAPSDRPASDEESDAYVGAMGAIISLRCFVEREN